jgi:hypothetical protein
MSRLTPIRDEHGQIIGMRGQGEAPSGVRAGIAAGAQRRFDELLPEPAHEEAEPPRPRFNLLRQWQRTGLAAAAVLLAALTIWLTRTPPNGSSRAFEEPPTQLARTATAMPSAAPTTGTRELVLAHAVVAYAAPAGQVLGALDAGRRYQVIARSGDEWRRVAAGDAGAVWVRTNDLPQDAAAPVPDLATATPAVQEAVQSVVQPATAPVVCDEAGAPYRVSREVLLNDRPIGRVAAWSCTSADDAEARAAQQERLVRTAAQATETAAAAVGAP